VQKGERRRDHHHADRAGLQHRISNAIGAAIETVRRRVDAMGTAEANIVRQGISRILVQVPGCRIRRS
jgi:preprotein translocase subunit SecD